MKNFFDELQQATEQSRRYLLGSPLILRALRGDVSLDEYVAFLTQAYYHVRHTVPLLMTVGGRLPQDKEWLRTAVADYIEEELGHQEWILNDIAACGGDREAVRNGVPSPETELMVAYAYDTAQRGNPVGFFGMVLVLEGTSISLATRAADALRQSIGLPKNAFSYLYSHGSLDQEHMKFFERLMNRIECPRDRAAVTHAAAMFYRLYGNIFRALELNAVRAVA